MVGEPTVLQQLPLVQYVSADDLVVLFALPFLGNGLVLYVTEDFLGHPEHTSFTVAGFVLLALTVLVAPTFDRGVAVALQRVLGWQIGFQVGRPLTIYWGIWTGLSFLAAYDEWTDDASTGTG